MKQKTNFKKANIEKVFEKLKKEKLISEKRKLKKCDLIGDFKAFSNAIYYGPLFSNMKEDNLRFILLHEEGHLKKYQKANIPLVILFLGIVAGGYLIFIKEFSLFVGSIFIILAWYFLVTKKFLRSDELNSDLFAFNSLNKNDKDYSPKIVEFAMKELIRKRDIKRENVFVRLQRKIPAWVYPHPPIKERVKNLEKNEK